MLYVCSKYHVCDSYVRVHPGTKIPVGTMANRDLRALRNEAHRNFDQLHKQGLMSKEDAYLWLASILAAPLGQAHIGYLGEYYCRQVIEASKQQLENAKRRLNENDNHAVKRAIWYVFFQKNHVPNRAFKSNLALNMVVIQKKHWDTTCFLSDDGKIATNRAIAGR